MEASLLGPKSLVLNAEVFLIWREVLLCSYPTYIHVNADCVTGSSY